jgi:hypothetical protein
MAEFWDMTPREVLMAIEASIWRDERNQQMNIVQAWRIAMMMRAKRIPSLKALLNTKPAKPLHGKELEKRRREFKEMTANVDINKLFKKKE